MVANDSTANLPSTPAPKGPSQPTNASAASKKDGKPAKGSSKSISSRPAAAAAAGNLAPPPAAAWECGPTVKLYLKDTWLFSCDGVAVIGSREDGTGTFVLALDKTIFHPQGGGQPADVGTVRGGGGSVVFAVTMVKEDRASGVVEHTGTFTAGGLGDLLAASKAGLALAIDGERRRFNARCHSAGHALDVSMELVGHALKAAKGYHFPDGPYVEYTGSLGTAEVEALPGLLTAKIRELVAQALPSSVAMCSKDKVLWRGGCPLPPPEYPSVFYLVSCGRRTLPAAQTEFHLFSWEPTPFAHPCLARPSPCAPTQTCRCCPTVRACES